MSRKHQGLLIQKNHSPIPTPPPVTPLPSINSAGEIFPISNIFSKIELVYVTVDGLHWVFDSDLGDILSIASNEGENTQELIVVGNFSINDWSFNPHEDNSTLHIRTAYLRINSSFLTTELNGYWYNFDYSYEIYIGYEHKAEGGMDLFRQEATGSFFREDAIEIHGRSDPMEIEIGLKIVVTRNIGLNNPREDFPGGADALAREIYAAFDFQLKYSFVYDPYDPSFELHYEEHFGLGWFLLCYRDDDHDYHWNETWHLKMTQIKPLTDWRPLFLFHSVGENDRWITYGDQDDWLFRTLKVGESWSCSFPHYSLIIEALIIYKSDI